MSKTLMLQTDRYQMAAILDETPEKLTLTFGYNKFLLAEVKAMEGARWDPANKSWSFDNSPHNHFRLKYLLGQNPYRRWEQPLIELSDSDRPIFKHQMDMAKHGLTSHAVVLACEMGTGKSLAAIEMMERSGIDGSQIWYIGPKAGVMAVTCELIKWGCATIPLMYTYEQLTKIMQGWVPGRPPPKFVIFDESSKLKTPDTKRSRAAQALADAIRAEHGDDGYIVLMTGTPAPKSPLDWFSQCEIACPGFVREGDINKFKKRLALMAEGEGIGGIKFPKIVTWWDDENKCQICGVHKAEHDFQMPDHAWEASVNEVAKLYRRMKGLVVVHFKKDCLDLPEKTYEVIKLKPTVEMVRAARLVQSTVSGAAQALIRLRELSDGFQYTEVESGTKTCTLCEGKGVYMRKMPKRNSIDVSIEVTSDIVSDDFEDQTLPCDRCGSSGREKTYERSIVAVSSPKDEYFESMLDEHEDVGRFIVWGGFTATVDRLVEMANKAGWDVLRVDGRGYHVKRVNTTPFDDANDDMVKTFLSAMDASHPKQKELYDLYPRICFVGQPKAGGMALTLTASPTELFFSNDFSGEARFQAEDRFHRAGMDPNRGARIVDLVLLPSDQLVLDNLKKKRDLQNITLGELTDVMKGSYDAGSITPNLQCTLEENLRGRGIQLPR